MFHRISSGIGWFMYLGRRYPSIPSGSAWRCNASPSKAGFFWRTLAKSYCYRATSQAIAWSIHPRIDDRKIYISSSDDPCGCLDKVLGLRCRPEDEGTLSSELDLLYLHILSSVKNVETTKTILGVILFVDPDYDFFTSLTSIQPSAAQTLSGVEMLVGLNPGQAASHISELHPMIQYDDNGNIFVSHATVAEFFHDQNRSKSFHLDRRHILNTVVDRCFQIIRNGMQFLLVFIQVAINDVFPLGGDHLSTRYAYGRLPQLCVKIPWTSGFLRNFMEFCLLQCHQWCERNADRIGATLMEKDRNLFPWWYVTRFLTLLRILVRVSQILVQHVVVTAALGTNRSVLAPPISFWQVDTLKPFKIPLWRFPIAACTHKHPDAIYESHTWAIFHVPQLSSGEEFHAQVRHVNGWLRTSFALSRWALWRWLFPSWSASKLWYCCWRLPSTPLQFF